MKKYLKYLLLIPIYLLSLIISLYLLLRIPPEIFGCEGFGCFGLIFLIPQLAVILAIPISVFIYYLISRRSGFLKNLFLSMKQFFTKPFPHKKFILLFSSISTVLLITIIIYSFKTDNRSDFQIKAPGNPTPTAIISKVTTKIPNVNMMDWKTYTNNKYSYSFSYKEIETLEFRSCGISPSNFSGEERIVFMEIPNSYNVCFPIDWIADIDIWTTQGNKTTSDAIEKDYPRKEYEIQIEEIIIDNVKAYKIKSHFIGEVDVDGYGFSPPDLTEVRVFNNGYTYHLYLGNEEYEDTFNQILSTFKLIPDTSNWKTYITEQSNIAINRKYKIKFKYPPLWKLGEYKSSDISIAGVAIDPFGPATKEELDTLDISEGLVSFGWASLSKSETEKFDLKVGQNSIYNARKTEEYTNENHPNPYYFNKHLINYYVEIYDGWCFGINYFSEMDDRYISEFNAIISTLEITTNSL